MQMNLWSGLDRLPGRTKIGLTLGFDLIALSIALWASYALRYGRWTPPTTLEQFGLLLVAPLLAVAMFWFVGVYRLVVRYLSDRALWQIVQAFTISVLCWVVIAFLTEMSGQRGVPRSVPLLYWALGAVLVVGARLLFRHVSARSRYISGSHPTIIYGAGDAGVQLSSAMAGGNKTAVVAFLDDDPNLHGRVIGGVPVYASDALDELIEQHGVREVVLAIPSLPASRRKQLVAGISRRNLTIKTLPSLMEWVNGQRADSQVRDIDVDELLGRSEVPADPVLLRSMIEGRNILVTGAGGSIGSELCRLIVKWSPACLVLLEANEFALYQIDRELENSMARIVPILGSIADANRVREAIADQNVNVIFHAAAHKHVPLLEQNVLEGIRNNVFGTQMLAKAAFERGVDSFVLISSDKAVRPTNVMGATKRWAELIVFDYSLHALREGKKQLFCSVRFGNVLGSNGSVVPLFEEQIAKGGPVTLTDDRMTRYFMSIHEAAELIVQAGALSEGGDTFLLEMGAPVRIRDLAENMISLSGLSVRDAANPSGDIEIVTVGTRPGEKLYEELFYDEVDARQTAHPKIMRASMHQSGVVLEEHLDALKEAHDRQDVQAARSILFNLIQLQSE